MRPSPDAGIPYCSAVKRAGLAVVLFVAVACSGGRTSPTTTPDIGSSSTGASAPPTKPPFVPPVESSPTVSTAPGGLLLYGGEDVDHPAGRYLASEFEFPFEAGLDEDLGIRDSGQSKGFVYIGQDKNAPAKGDEEFDAMFLVKVLDPDDQRSLHDLTGDVMRWFRDHPRLTLVRGSEKTIKIDRLPARQTDFLPSRPVPCGNFHRNLSCVLIGFGPPSDEPFALFKGSRLRLVVVDHPGRQVVFAYQSLDSSAFPSKVAVFDHWVRSVDFR